MTSRAVAFLAGRIPGEFTRSVSNTVGGDVAMCNRTNLWTFELRDVGGNSGINPPPSITARTATGTTLRIPLTRTNGASGSYPWNAAFYETATTRRLTGEATAMVSTRWRPQFPWFALVSGPCTQPTLTTTTTPSVVVVGGTVNFRGRLTAANGRAMANRPISGGWHSTSRDGKGVDLGPFVTDSNGRFATNVIADEPGAHYFGFSYLGSGPTALGHWYAIGPTATVWALPPSVPAANGPLASSAGTSFSATSRRTRLSGTGFTPNADIGIALYGGLRLIATTTTDAAGAFDVEVTIPAGIAGQRTLVALGTAYENDELFTRYLTLPITVRR